MRNGTGQPLADRGQRPQRHRDDGLELERGMAPDAVIELVSANLAGDRARLEAVLAPDLELRDNRIDPPFPFTDRAALISVMEQFGADCFDMRLLAVRGELFSLLRVRVERAGAEPGDLLSVCSSRPDGVIDRMHVFDAVDLSDALRQLALMWAETLDPSEGRALLAVVGYLRTLSARDFDAHLRLVDDGFVHVDYREGATLVFDRDESTAMMASVLEDDLSLIDYATEIHALGAHGLVASRTQATIDTLGVTDTEVALVATNETGLVTLLEFYDPDDLDRALTRFATIG
jgi:hypothetical protein